MTDSVNTRELILDLLIEILEKDAYSHLVLRGVLAKHQYLEKRERAFITNVTEGTLENLIQIDDIIDRCASTPVKKQKPLIRNLLRSSVYQIVFLDGVPDSAACNEAVKLAKKRGFGNLRGFVNGVLRTVSRRKGDICLQENPVPTGEKEFSRYLSIKYSIPEWILLLWKEELGYCWDREEDRLAIEQMLAAFQGSKETTIRTNLMLTTPEKLKENLQNEGIEVKDTALPYAFRIEGYDYLGGLPDFQNGEFYIQDLSSMMVVEAGKPKEGELVLDVCSAPGGKALHAAEWMRGTGKVIARDLSKAKVELIKDNISRCRLSNIQAEVWDATVFDPQMEEGADLVLADLPCSGLGVLRRKKDIRYKMTAEKLGELVALQRSILEVARRYVKPGGRLVYSTCTIHRAENAGNVEWFLKKYPEFRLSDSRQLIPGEWAGDGFYLALLERSLE